MLWDCFVSLLYTSGDWHKLEIFLTQACTVRQRADLKFSGRHVIEQIQTVCVCVCICVPACVGVSAWVDDVVYVCKKLLSSSVFCWQVLEPCCVSWQHAHLKREDWNRWMNLIDIRLHVGVCMCLCIQLNMLGEKKINRKIVSPLQTNDETWLLVSVNVHVACSRKSFENVHWWDSGDLEDSIWSIYSGDVDSAEDQQWIEYTCFTW